MDPLDSRFLPLRPNPEARIRLFCFPFAGGGAGPYRTWARGLPGDVDVCPVQLPGRENRLREPAYTDAPRLLAKLGEVLTPAMDRPFAFFGHSMGGLLSFELARRLRREGRLEPTHIFLAAVLPPERLVQVPPIHHLPDEAFIKALSVRYDGMPAEVLQNEELLKLYLPVLRADLTLLDTYSYTPEEPLTCPISAFGGAKDWAVGQDDIAAWRAHTTGPFRMRMFPGGHFFLNEDRLLLLQALAHDLARCTPTSQP